VAKWIGQAPVQNATVCLVYRPTGQRLLGEEAAVAEVKVSTGEVVGTLFDTLGEGITKVFRSRKDKPKGTK